MGRGNKARQYPPASILLNHIQTAQESPFIPIKVKLTALRPPLSEGPEEGDFTGHFFLPSSFSFQSLQENILKRLGRE